MTTPENPDSPGLRRWTDHLGVRWECDAYDHGPFCRQCRLSEPESVEEAIADNIRLGYVEVVGVNDDGEIMYRITPEGEARVKGLLDE